jgi:hypothetical protein
MPDYLLAALVSILMVVLCVTVHYEMLVQLERLSRSLRRHRWMILVVMHGLLVAHVIEIWLFGFAYFAAERWLELGSILPSNGDWFEHIYYSAIVYTTVGFGDLVPEGALRMITATEALAGLALITWSASFAFLQMQRIWRP